MLTPWLDIDDLIHSEDESRFVIIGFSEQERLLVVVYAERDSQTIRIIKPDPRKRAKDDSMEKPDGNDSDMLDGYDFTHGRRGRYAQRFGEGTNVILLDADVVANFRESREVNDALRELLDFRKKAG